MTAERPPMFYDYYGFPPDSYRITWPAPGSPALAARVRELLGGAGVTSAEDSRRGFDHGTFIPLKLTYPEAEVPTVQLSLKRGLDPAEHLAMGRALAPLRRRPSGTGCWPSGPRRLPRGRRTRGRSTCCR
jgi:aromatic ring-opening dioxygenase catalytic subunit (LigB family)